jgi:hypothetical protein
LHVLLPLILARSSRCPRRTIVIGPFKATKYQLINFTPKIVLWKGF